MSTHFKLIQHDGFTRRVTFPSQPTWYALAAKVQSLYAIPSENVSVAYIDAENDEITLSTQEELDDFYQTDHQPGQLIKFIVQDLSSTHVQRKSPPRSPVVNVRDTFGGEGFDIEDDWQRLPTFPSAGGLFSQRASDIPHAFVEVVESDASNLSNQHEPNTDGGSNASIQFAHDDRFSASSNKGKERAVADDGSSTRSVLAEDTPTKHPIHIFDHSPHDKDEIPGLFGLGPAVRGQPLFIPTESTPKVTAQDLTDTETNPVNDAQSAPNSPEVEVADPPLPSLESIRTPNTSPSLCNDVASLLTTFTTVVNGHPELSEGLHNIIRNTAGGTYWNAHREAISNAAEQLAQTTEEARSATEEEAGRRVADALGGIILSLSQTLGTINPGPSQPAPSEPAVKGGSTATPADQTEQPATANSTSSWYGASRANARPWRGGLAPHPPFFAPWMRGRPPFESPRGWGSWGPSSPAVPPPGGPPGSHHDFMHTHGPPHPPPPPPPPPPLPPHPLPGSWDSETPVPWGSVPMNNSFRAKPTPEESKAKVDAARLRYKAEKERYRQERETRKKERDHKARTVGGEIRQNVQIPTSIERPDNTPAGSSNTRPAAIVSNGRGDYPTIELVSVQRHHTHPGHGPPARRNMYEHTDVKARTLNRISRRLADMGFTDNAYPELPGKIKAQMPPSGVVSKDTEDDIVTTLLEELLAMSPRPHSGSNAKDKSIPGAWH